MSTISFISRVWFDFKGIDENNLKEISDILQIATNFLMSDSDFKCPALCVLELKIQSI